MCKNTATRVVSIWGNKITQPPHSLRFTGFQSNTGLNSRHCWSSSKDFSARHRATSKKLSSHQKAGIFNDIWWRMCPESTHVVKLDLFSLTHTKSMQIYDDICTGSVIVIWRSCLHTTVCKPLKRFDLQFVQSLQYLNLVVSLVRTDKEWGRFDDWCYHYRLQSCRSHKRQADYNTRFVLKENLKKMWARKFLYMTNFFPYLNVWCHTTLDFAIADCWRPILVYLIPLITQMLSGGSPSLVQLNTIWFAYCIWLLPPAYVDSTSRFFGILGVFCVF